MDFSLQDEIRTILEADESRLGDTYRGDLQGFTPEEHAAHDGVATTGYVSNNRTIIAALLDGTIPAGPTLSLAAARKVRSYLRHDDLSPALRDRWEQLEHELMIHAEDPGATRVEDVASAIATEKAESQGIPGVYVYTLPHYLRYPVDPETGKTYLKVGHSSRDIFQRIGAQNRTTALPEDPILLRIYPSEISSSCESEFHAWLRAADHHGARTSKAGTEWFLTTTKFLDRIAQTLGLEIRVINDAESGI
ncbi:GIY-YIG nuclease family protein [Arcanobacterium haemolyticum]|nr:GIY-YIG nuclease family protein [Arcanobacterium haemolyticum]